MIIGSLEVEWKKFCMWKTCINQSHIHTKGKTNFLDEDKWKLLHHNATGMIRPYVDQSVFRHVGIDTYAYDIWTMLESIYMRKKALKKHL